MLPADRVGSIPGLTFIFQHFRETPKPVINQVIPYTRLNGFIINTNPTLTFKGWTTPSGSEEGGEKYRTNKMTPTRVTENKLFIYGIRAGYGVALREIKIGTGNKKAY